MRLLWLLLVPAVSFADVHVAVLPSTQTVMVGDSVGVELWVTEAGSGFNGYDLGIAYDSTALTFEPTNPIHLQMGWLIPNAADSCPTGGAVFHVFRSGPNFVGTSMVLFCLDGKIPGPGQLYKLNFRAKSVGLTSLRWVPEWTEFYHAGIYVRPVFTTDAVVEILPPVSVEPSSKAIPEGIYDVQGRRVDEGVRSGVTFGKKKQVKIK